MWKQLAILNEPLIPPMEEMYGDGPTDPMPVPEYQDYALKRTRYIARYMEYWNSTVKLTGTGRPVDTVIMPVAPHAAVIPNKYFHYGLCLPQLSTPTNGDTYIKTRLHRNCGLAEFHGCGDSNHNCRQVGRQSHRRI